MNPQWNTPPSGDFVRYAEQLTAQSLQAARKAPGAQHRLDTGADVASTHALVGQGQGQGPGQALAAAGVSRGGLRGFARKALLAWAGLLFLLFVSGAHGAALILLAIWIGAIHVLRRWLLPSGGPAGFWAAAAELLKQDASPQPKKKLP